MPTGFANVVNMGYEREREKKKKDDTMAPRCYLNTWEDAIAFNGERTN